MSKLDEIRSRRKHKEQRHDIEKPKSEGQGKLVIKRWFDNVREHPEILPEAIGYFSEVIEDGSKHVTCMGHLQTLVAETPGLTLFYKCVLTDAQQIRRWLDEKANQKEATTYKWLMTSPEAKAEYGELKTTEAGKFAKADEKLLELMNNVRRIAYVEHGLDDIVVGLQSRAIMLNRLVDIRTEGLQDVWIDPTKETRNE